MTDKSALYVYRPLMYGEQLVQWAKVIGLKDIVDPEEMHVTIAYSRNLVKWSQLKIDMTMTHVILPDQPRSIVVLDKGIIALKFDSVHFQKRWQYFIDNGASWDYPSYQSHVTLSYKGSKRNFKNVEPFKDELQFGSEEWKPLDLNWKPKKAPK